MFGAAVVVVAAVHNGIERDMRHVNAVEKERKIMLVVVDCADGSVSW